MNLSESATSVTGRRGGATGGEERQARRCDRRERDRAYSQFFFLNMSHSPNMTRNIVASASG